MNNQSKLLDKIYENNKTNFSMSVAMIVLGAVNSTVSAVVLQKIMDLAVAGPISEILKMGIFTMAFVGFTFVVEMVKRFYKNRFIEKALVQLKSEMLRRLMKKNIATFQDESTAEYISEFTNDINSITENYLLNIFDRLIAGGLNLIFAIIVMLRYNVLMTIIILLVLVLSFVPTMLAGKGVPEMEGAVSNQNGRFTGQVKDLLSGFPVIKNFRVEDRVTRLFDKENEILESKKCQRRRKYDMIGIIGGSTGFGVQCIILLLGAAFAVNGKISPGTLMAFVQLMGQVLGPIQMLPPSLADRGAALQLLEKAERNLSVNVNTTHEQPIPRNRTGITFDRVSFAYEGGNTVLRDINLKLEHGKSYAIVGASGSGKTTLMNLLLGGFDNYTGSIRINGQEIRTASYESLYELIAVVWQNVFIFDSTIEENITMFKDCPYDRMRDVIEKAQLDTLIRGKGLSYQCGENGSQLSGGEKQRISIARCLLQNTDILILDEATSALDAETAQYVEETIKNLQGMMRIVITHKLNQDVLRDYDNIIVLKDGTIDGFGTYDELWYSNDYFRKLMEITA